MLAASAAQAQQDLPTVWLGFDGPSDVEEGDTIRFRIFRDSVGMASALKGVAININPEGGSYLRVGEIGSLCPGYEHYVQDRCFTIPAGRESLTVDIPTYATTSFEKDTRIFLGVRGGLPQYHYRNHYIQGNPKSIHATVRDGPDVPEFQPDTVTLSVLDARAAEGNPNDDALLHLRLTRDGSSGLTAGESLRVPLVFSGGQPGTDFTLDMIGVPGGVTFDSATSTVTFTGPSSAEVFLQLYALDDADADDETVTVAVPEPVASGIAGTVEGRRRGNGQIRLIDDDEPTDQQTEPQVAITAAAGGTEGTAATFTIQAHPAPKTSLPVSVTVDTVGDFGVAAGKRTVTIPTSGIATLTLPTTDDSTDEADGSVTVTVNAGDGYTVLGSQSSRTVSILDNDEVTDGQTEQPEVTIEADAASKTEGGDASFTLTADPKPASSLAVSVTVATSGDFGVTAGKRTVTIPSSGSAKLTLSTTDDSTDEADGSVSATVGAGDGYTVGSPSLATVSILDDDDPPLPEVTIAADAASKTEGGDASFTLTADPKPASSLAVSVTVATSGDYGVTAGRRTVTIPSSGSAKLTLSTTDDEVDEADGSVSATVGAGDGYTVGSPSLATVSILDDDDPPLPEVTIAADAASKTEGGDASFTLTADPKPASSLAVSVTVATSGDFGVTAGKRTVAIPSSGSAQLTLSTTDDQVDEADGSVSATLGAGDGYTVGSPSSASVSILDDDAAAHPVTLSLAAERDSIAEENGETKFTISLSRALVAGETVTAPFTVTGGQVNAHWNVAFRAGDNGAGVERTAYGPHSEIRFTAGGRTAVLVLIGRPDADTADRVITVAFGTGARRPTATGVAGGIVLGTSSFDVTIVDDDRVPPEVTVSEDASSVDEGEDASFTISADPAPESPLAVSVTVATSGDYGVTAGRRTVTIPSSGSAKLTLSTTDDSRDEADGSVSATVKAGDGYTVGSPSSATVSILDDDDPPLPEVTIEADAASKTEGGDASFTLTADPKPASSLAVSVTVATSGDFGVTAGKRTVTIPSSGSAKLTLSTTDDSRDEADGSVSATVKAGDGYTVGSPSSATVSILDDDDPPLPEVTIEADAASKTEGGDASFTLTADPKPASSLAVSVTVATSGDFGVTAGKRTVTIPSSGSAKLTLSTTDDSRDEADGSVSATVKAGDGYTVGSPSSATVSILDDDDPPLPEVTIEADAASKTEGGDASFTLTADPKPASSLAVSVTVATSGDFGVTAGKRTVTIPSSGSAKLTLSTTDDQVDEADGSVSATLGAGDGYTVGSPSSATVSILDDDDPPLPRASFASGSQSAAESAGTRTVTVNLSPAPQAAVTLNYTVGGTAAPGADYKALSGRAAVSTGAGSVDIPVVLTDDSADEASETVVLTLTAGSGYAVANPRVHTLTITDDDDPLPEVTIAADASSATEGEDASFTLTANPRPAASVDVSVTVAASGDYGVTPGSRTVTIPASGSAKLTLSTTDDSTDEADGSVTATVNADGGYTVGSPSSATVSIADDDPAAALPVVSLGDDQEAPETGVLQFPVELSAAAAHEVGVRWDAETVKV